MHLINGLFLMMALFVVSVSAEANRARFLFKDSEALQARIDLIQQARKEILVEYYSVWNDDESISGFALLVEAARNGIPVKVVLDSHTNNISNVVLASLMAKAVDRQGRHNLEIKLYNRVGLLNILDLTNRTHAKMIIVDGEKILTGGRNISKRYFGFAKTERNYEDLDIIVQGPVASEARENFYKQWNAKTVKDPHLFSTTAKSILSDACDPQSFDFSYCDSKRKYLLNEMNGPLRSIDEKIKSIETFTRGAQMVNQSNQDWFTSAHLADDVQFMSHEPTQLVSPKTALMTKDLLETLLKAQSEVLIVSPYMIPTENLMKAFETLIARKVKVVIITNSARSTDNMLAQAGYREYRSQLIAMGVELYEFIGPNTLHAKTALIDRKVTLIGSYNIDPRSAFINREVGLKIIEDIYSNPIATELHSYIVKFQKKSILVGKDKREQNLENDDEGISFGNLLLLKAVKPFIHKIIPQL